jgi:hypothetical protein
MGETENEYNSLFVKGIDNLENLVVDYRFMLTFIEKGCERVGLFNRLSVD